MDMDIEKAIEQLQDVINKLDDLKDCGYKEVETASNTYFVGSNFISFGSYGFLDMQDIKGVDIDG